MNTHEYNDQKPKHEPCRCGDMPGRCPGVANCPLCEDEEDE